MKTSVVSTLAILPILTTVSAFEIADIYKKTLGNSDCTAIHLTEGRILRANCVKPGYGSRSLNHVTNGGFSGSCAGCHMDGTKLICECLISPESGIKHNEVELDNWDLIQVNDDILTCGSDSVGLEMRGTGKAARFFTA
ncbi:hypothetical protein Daesc_009720 [Daldinia eschscholtzii]|uniref:Cyanovirin-N domain-containing protein n=1 Tax=Daldinia eschscholtzii TaxID=292717 RepID=A0AAX6MB78_9PEZI